MSQNNTLPEASQPDMLPLDLEKQSRQSLQALGTFLERIAPWLFPFGSWIFGGLLAVSLLVIPALITVGPAHTTVLLSFTAFIGALPLNVAGLLLLRLTREMQDAGIDEHLFQSFQEAGFPIETYMPQERSSLLRKRTHVALSYAIGILTLSVVVTLVGIGAACWFMAWWIGITFLAMVLLSLLLIILVVVHSFPPLSEEEKEYKRRYQEHRARQTQKRSLSS